MKSEFKLDRGDQLFYLLYSISKRGFNFQLLTQDKSKHTCFTFILIK
jgi:hypothetical protein